LWRFREEDTVLGILKVLHKKRGMTLLALSQATEGTVNMKTPLVTP
jgi:hypothetical protein